MSSVCLDDQGEVVGVLCSEDFFTEPEPDFLEPRHRVRAFLFM